MVRHKFKITLKTWSSNFCTCSKSLCCPRGGITLLLMAEQGTVERWLLSLTASYRDHKASNRGESSCLLFTVSSLIDLCSSLHSYRLVSLLHTDSSCLQSLSHSLPPSAKETFLHVSSVSLTWTVRGINCTSCYFGLPICLLHRM